MRISRLSSWRFVSFLAMVLFVTACERFSVSSKVLVDGVDISADALKLRIGQASTPTGLQAHIVSSSEIDLSWLASSIIRGQGQISQYRIYRNGALLASIEGTQTAFQDKGLLPATAYSYQVGAVNSAGNQSSLSAPVSATTLSAGETAAPIPTPGTTSTATPAPSPAYMPTPTPTPQPLQDALVFKANDPFGVSHPDQILSFPLPAGSQIDPAANVVLYQGTQVPYQVSPNGDLLVRINGGAQANSQHEWRMQAGIPADFANGLSAVKVRDIGSSLEIDNGLVAVRVAKSVSGLGPKPIGDAQLDDGPFVPAPIQGMRHVDGTWTGTGPNALLYLGWDANWRWRYINFPAKTMQTRVVENGPLRVTVEVEYSAYRPTYQYGDFTYPAGDGYYKSSISLEAGQNAVMVKEVTDMSLNYRVDLNRGVNADRGRYRGHHASDIVYGRQPDGTVYNSESKMDAEVDINYSQPVEVAYYSSPTTRQPLYMWYDWSPNTGYYWQLFNSASSDGNMFGLFQGPQGQVQGCPFTCFVGIYNRVSDSGAYEAGVSMSYYYRSVTGVTATDHKYGYGIFLGRKSTDLAEPSAAQPIAKKMNIYSGISLNKTIKYRLEFPDPAEGWQGIQLSFDQMARKIQAIRSDSQGISSKLYQEDPYYRDIWLAFQDTSMTKANELAGSILAIGSTLLDAYVNKGTIYTHEYSYWIGGTHMEGYSVRANALLVLDRVSPFLSEIQRAKLKATLSLFGNILWDNDFVPLDNYQSFTLGTANMPVEQQGFRQHYAIMLKDHPSFSARARAALSVARGQFDSSTNDSGATMSSPHYSGASIVPTTDTLRQLQVIGVYDEFQVNARIKKTAEFLMQLMTPPEPRYGYLRKMFASGDGSTEGTDQMLSMIMGYSLNDPTLSKRLMGTWRAQGMPYTSFFGSSGLKIDETMPSQDPALGDGDFPGYMSVMRSGWGTADESAIYHLNGTFYRDHAGCDIGGASIYLLGAPVSIMWGSFYYPQVVGGLARNLFLPESLLPRAWTDPQPLQAIVGNYCAPGMQVTSRNFSASGSRGDSFVTFDTGWSRQVTMYRDQISQPIVRIRDNNPTSPSSIMSLNMMAKGAVVVPGGGQVTPLIAPEGSVESTAGALFNLPSGQANLKFTGQWGVSWDVFVIDSPGGGQAYIGEWGHSWNPTVEAVQYTAATGQPFSERQYILRMKNGRASDVVIVPYRTGQRPSDLSVSRVNGAIVVRSNGVTRTLAD